MHHFIPAVTQLIDKTFDSRAPFNRVVIWESISMLAPEQMGGGLKWLIRQ